MPRASKTSDRVVFVSVTTASLGREGRTTFERARGDSVAVSTASAPESEPEFMNFLVNVTSHGVGHATGALPQYSKDAAPVGSFLNPSGLQAEPGSVMETNVDAEVVGREARDFSPADAEQLQETLNDLPPE